MEKYVLICRTCGREHELAEDSLLVTCGACGTVNQRPQAQGAALNLFQRAVRLRISGEYRAAERCYDAVLVQHDDEYEALWGRLLCHYGVEYIVEEATGRRYPTVHIPRRRPLQETADFAHACALAPEHISRQYMADAAYIDEAQAEIRQLAQSCAPYDVFLCHKCSRPGTTDRTEDYDRAFRWYHRLKMLGYRVFFAPMDMEGVAAGANYEAAIYYALNTARVMLVVCSSQEYLNSTWVQSEWKRYIELQEDETDPAPRCLLPLLYGGMRAEQLPREFRLRKIQGVVMENPDAYENVMRVLRQYCKLPGGGPVDDGYAPAGDFQTGPVEGGCAITGYLGQGGRVCIPPVIAGQRVMRIGRNAFRDCVTLREIVIPMGVAAIDEYALQGCTALEKAEIADSVVEIHWRAFQDCDSLRQVHIPAGVRRMTANPFPGCRSLTTVTVAPENPAFHARDNVVFSAAGELLCYPSGLTAARYDIPGDVKRIAVSAFDGCEHLTEVIIPQGVTEIGHTCFHDCRRLREVCVPQSVTSIGVTAFMGCPELVLGVYPASAAQAYAQKNHILHRALTTYAPESHFQTMPAKGKCFVAQFTGKPVERGCVITGYTGPGGVVEIPPEIGGEPVVEIGECAFDGCETLTGVRVPEGVMSLCIYAFGNCPQLTDVMLPDSLTHIFAYAFDECSSLTKLVIPESVRYISDSIVSGCGLTSVNIPAAMTGHHANPFAGCETLRSIRMSPGNTAYYLQDGVLFSRQGELVCYPGARPGVEYEIPEGTKAIAAWAFSCCDRLEKLYIPPCVTELPPYIKAYPILRVHAGSAAHTYAMEQELEYELIQTVTVEAHFATEAAQDGVCITRYAGPGGEVEIPEKIGGQTVVGIGSRAFEGCDTLVKLLIPEGVERIGSYAFSRCTRLKNVHVPVMLTYLGEGAFSGCSALLAAEIPHQVTGVGEGTFRDCRSLLFLTIPENVRTIGESAFAGCSGLKRLRFAGGVTIIGESAFAGCSSLTEAALPEGLQSIGRRAFSGCTALRTVTIPRSAGLVAEGAFQDCPAVMLRVYRDSGAHTHAKYYDLRCEVIGGEPDSRPKPADATPATLCIRRSSSERISWMHKVCVRVDGKEYLLGLGDNVTLKVRPGHHRIDLKRKPLLGSIDWNSGDGAMNVVEKPLEEGREYTLDVADFARQL